MAYEILKKEYDKSSLEDRWADAFSSLIDAEEEKKLDYQYKSIDACIAPGKKILDGLEQVPEQKDLNALNIQIMGEYLYLLGYVDRLPDDTDPYDQNDPKFKDAVKRFQNEAGLTVDAWIGDQTWRALQALVGFESDTEIKRWRSGDGTFCRAFRRAAQLRLWTYGIATKRPAAQFTYVTDAAKAKFKKILWMLGALEDYRKNVDDSWLFEQLFDADNLVQMAANSHDGQGSFFDAGLRHLQQSSSIFANNDLFSELVFLKGRFIANIVKIEIWLLGGGTKIDGKGDFPVRGLGAWKQRRRKGEWKLVPFQENPDIKGAIGDYVMHALGSKEKRFDIAEITPELLLSFLEPEELSDAQIKAFDESDYSERLLSKLESYDDKGAAKIKEAFDNPVKTIGMKLWDGVKRVWRWIKKGIDIIVDFSSNLMRAIFRFAHKAYKIVRLSYDAFMHSARQYLQGSIETHHPLIAVAIKGDFDTKVAFHESVNATDIETTCTLVRRFGAMFHLSCAIVSAFIKIILSVVSGFAGWIRLIWVLMKSYREIRPKYRELSDLLS